MERTRIALALGLESTTEARRALEKFARHVDVVELRLDMMKEWYLPELLHDHPCPVIVTCRPAWEGGRFEGDEQIRIETLVKAAELGAEHIDCELEAVARLAGRELGATKLIVSKHDFDAMPNLAVLHQRCCEAGADVAKVVGMATSATDVLPAAEVLRGASAPSIAFAMGAQGVASRLLAVKYGAYLTFASLDNADRQTAPGQLSLETLREVYLIRDIDAGTTVYGHLAPGEPDHVALARANRTLRSAGHNAVVVPLVIEDDDPGAVVAAFRESGFGGFSVHPVLGAAAMHGAEQLDGTAEVHGRADCIVTQDGYWMGYASNDTPLDLLLALQAGP